MDLHLIWMMNMLIWWTWWICLIDEHDEYAWLMNMMSIIDATATLILPPCDILAALGHICVRRVVGFYALWCDWMICHVDCFRCMLECVCECKSRKHVRGPFNGNRIWNTISEGWPTGWWGWVPKLRICVLVISFLHIRVIYIWFLNLI